MSSMTRRMQIRGLKRLGYLRTNYRVAKTADGEEQKIRVPRGGLILNSDGAAVGYRWPRPALV